jgi:ATP-dependent Clp protease ATP-binding subunit ClpA
MFERSKTGARVVILDAMQEARVRADAKVEAEHLLLALARRSASDAGRVLVDAGLDHDHLRTALDEGVHRTLEAVGVALRLPDSSLPMTGQPSWGESAKAALRRATTIAKDRGNRHLTPSHILLGVLHAREGTVPRTLAAAGVDPRQLAVRIEETIGRTT